MKNHTRMTHDAVSPVIAVMLMLVVTIIIAAVVSAFAGGMTDTKNTAPQASISATYSLSKGMMIYHEGGDELTWYNVKLLVTPQMGSVDYQNRKSAISYEVVKSNTSTGTRYIHYMPGLQVEGFNYAAQKIIIFKPGDVAYITPENLWVTQVRPDGTVEFYDDDYGMGNTVNGLLMGTYAKLDLVDTKNGDVIVASTKFKITP